MARADFAAEIPPVAVRWQKPEDVGLLGGRRQIELVSHFVCLSFRGVERMGSEPGRLMPDAVHVEGVEPDFADHGRPQIAPWRGGLTPFSQ